jgi:hypothetical protein
MRRLLNVGWYVALIVYCLKWRRRANKGNGSDTD